jgi:YHS domain-containing protein
LLALGYLLYRAFKTWMTSGSGGALRGGAARDGNQIDDLLVKDPHCGIYFSKTEGVSVEHDGQTLYFCSPECRDAFLQPASRDAG